MPKPPSSPKLPTPSSEVVADPSHDRRVRRTFTPAEKLRILAEADKCTERGELASLLRREGISSSHLSAWRAVVAGEMSDALQPKQRGPVPKLDAKDRRIADLEKRGRKLERELELARKLIDLQIKAHEILGIALPRIEDE